MTKKTGMLATVVLLAAVVFGFISYSSYKNSEEATVERLAAALLEGDQAAVKRYMPSYSNKKKISNSARKTFQKQMKRLKKDQVVKLLQTEDNFSLEKGSSFFKPAQIYPSARYLVIELPKETELQATIEAQNLSGQYVEEWNKYTFGPFLPGEYQVAYETAHPKFGSKNVKEKVDLNATDQRLTVKESSLYEGNLKFQKHLLASAVNYFDSMNEGIRDGLNVSRLVSSKEYKTTLQASFDKLKPYMESFDQEFQRITINCDSISVNNGQTKVQLDLYVDLKRSIKLVEEAGIDEALTSDKQNAIASFLYDEEQKKWLVDELDFSTYQQDPEKWEHVQSYRGESVKKAHWDKNGAEDVV
ncbi:hypothetical protein SAMN04487821_11263 [Enterococcus malodoratus]|uniref:hypothetical protein n=1 Tax=Enterococcus malodoratus TaxID=71451 RepID=UPI0008CE85C5|nr:hypothetical protein [Enterococcus malodoratus]SET44057.1 hypothetical protein SAMN04487821_11263 [Enterococcus malodoratus]